ncbi:MAG: EamA family transporter [Firmicutes bacterium]|nr:EamA family transporter [Bacillota bacterium]
MIIGTSTHNNWDKEGKRLKKETAPVTERNKAILFLVLAAILWSAGGLLIKSIVSWGPLAIAGARSGIAALVIFFYIYIRDKRLPRLQWSALQIGTAFCYAGVVILFTIANKMTTAANAILLQYTAPVYVALFSYCVLRERITVADWVTVGVVLGGMLLFFLDDLAPGNLVGNIFSVLSGVFFAAFTLLLRKQKDGSPAESVMLGNIITALVGLPFYFHALPTVFEWGALVFLGLFQLGVSYILYTIAIKKVTALEAILIPVIEPILNPVWVFLLLGETPGPWALVGGMVVLGAVTVLSIYKTKTSAVV